MQEISRALGSPLAIHFEDEDYLIYGLRAEDWGIVESHLLAKRPNPLTLANDAAIDTMLKVKKRIKDEEMPLEQAQVYLAQAQNVIEKSMERAIDEARKTNFISPQEMQNYVASTGGLAFCFWLSFEKAYPNRFKVKDMYGIFAAMSEEQRRTYSDKLAMASGVDDRSDSTGLTGETTSPDQTESKASVPGINGSAN